MIILDESGNEVTNPNLDIGYLKDDRVFIAHHEAIPEVPLIEEIDYEHPIAVYPNGGKVVETIVKQEYQPPKEAWDEYEDIKRYILYTDEELKAKKAERKKQDEEARKAFERESFLAKAPKRLCIAEKAYLDHAELLLCIISNMQPPLDEETAKGMKYVFVRTYARLVYFERKKIEEVPDEYKQSVKNYIRIALEGE